MKLMGLPNWMHWVSWFLNAYITSAISVLIMVALICIEWKPGTGAVSHHLVVVICSKALKISYLVISCSDLPYYTVRSTRT